jgi:arylsulfatase A-like enzyme
MDGYYQGRIESLLSVDEGFRDVVNALKQTGQYGNTIILFVGDNGYHLGEHRNLAGKQFAYEEDIRVPFLMRGPGIPQGQTIDALVTNVDYAPTILEFAKAQAGLPQDGRSLVPLIKNPNISWRSDFVVENPIGQDYYGLRTKDTNTGSEYLYVEYDYDADNTIDERELYAMTPDSCMATGDPYQLESQHNNSCYAPLIQQFEQRLAQMKVCAGSNCQA